VNTRSEIIAKAFNALKAGEFFKAKKEIVEKYPFQPIKRTARNYQEEDKIRIFRASSKTFSYCPTNIGW